MGLLEDLTTFLEQRLDEFLKSHPELELQVLDENLREQEDDTRRLMADLQAQQKQLESDILATAQDIQRWHSRIQKAEAAKREDLAEAAREREAALLRQGNQRWGQMQVLRERVRQTHELLEKVQTRRQEVQTQILQTQRQTGQSESSRSESSRSESSQSAARGWYQSNGFGEPDPLEEQFRRWETDRELEELKRSMGR